MGLPQRVAVLTSEEYLWSYHWRKFLIEWISHPMQTTTKPRLRQLEVTGRCGWDTAD